MAAQATADSHGFGSVKTLQTGFNLYEPYVLVTFEPIPTFTTSPTPCRSPDENRLIFDPSTEEGKVMMSFLLAAKAASQIIEYTSRGGCYEESGWGAELLKWIRVN